MYFLIGLGVIVVLVYGNMLYDHIKEKKKAVNRRIFWRLYRQNQVLYSRNLSKRRTGLWEKAGIVALNCHFSGPTLTEMIADDLRQKKNIFGLPLTLCEEADDGELIAMDREDNIYVIETVQRPEYEELYLQVLDDMTAQRKRIQKNAADRKVYAIVCVTTLSETLKLAAEKENSIRIFSYELNFRNIM